MELIRKVSLAKWKHSLSLGDGHISADAVTACLRTTDNALSVWKTENDQEFDMSVLALLASLTSMDTIDIVRLTAEELRASNLTLLETPGDTKAKGLEGYHRDIVNLDHAALKEVAEIVKSKVAKDEAIRYRKPEIKIILKRAVEAGMINLQELPEKIKSELMK